MTFSMSPREVSKGVTLSPPNPQTGKTAESLLLSPSPVRGGLEVGANPWGKGSSNLWCQVQCGEKGQLWKEV